MGEWLISRTFTFRVDLHDPIISDKFVFHKNGFIVGYSHRNEMFWDIHDGHVNIRDQDGRITCRLAPQSEPDNRIRLAGYFLDPTSGYEQTANLHILEENSSDYHTGIQSFDLFDTLVARRCHDPLGIFRIVEMKSGVVNFAHRRHIAEMSMFGHRTYGLDDIYNIMVAGAFLTERQAAVLKMMELEEEWEHLFPISEVVARVNDDDIVISDMYLPRPFVERILREKCGLQNRLYLSNYGKHHKEIWPEILQTYKLSGHFGDNIQADIIGPSSFGIPVNFVRISAWDRTEEILHGAGLGSYAHAVRETRLQTFHRDVRVHNALRAQVSINIPLMILGTLWIRLCAEKHGTDKILMAARDCNLWHEMLSSRHFAQIGMPPSEYIRISRSVCYIESPEYEAYLQGRLGHRNLLVDFVGTGKSLRAIIDRMERQSAIIPCVLVGEPALFDPGHAFPEILIAKDFHKYRVFLEAMNTSLDGSVVRTVFDNTRVRVLLQNNEFSDFARTIITGMRNTFLDFMTGLDRVDVPENIPSLETLRSAANAIAELLPAWAGKLTALEKEQNENLLLGNPLAAIRTA